MTEAELDTHKGRSYQPAKLKELRPFTQASCLLDFIMATIKVIQKRDQEAHFGLYRTSAGGDQEIFVRRKIADPTDYMHTRSRKLSRQRESFTLATKHYAQLTPTQKAITRHEMEEVEYQKSHGKTDTKLLSGRQLFISKEIRSLNVTQKQTVLPREICIVLTDQDLNPLEGFLWLFLYADGQWWELPSEQLSASDWLFPTVPRGAEFYRVIGAAEGYVDPLLEEHQFMSEDFLQTYHYHKLILGQPNIFTFYCDFHPEVSSVDGQVSRIVRKITWADLHGGTGTNAYPSHGDMPIRLWSDVEQDLWYALYRCIMTFDTHEIEPEAFIIGARLGVYGSSKSRRGGFILEPGVYGSNPILDTDLVPADYGRIYDTLLSDVITYDDIDPDDWNVWTLNYKGIAAINKGGITRLALRDSHYDAPNTPPPWEHWNYCSIIFHTADFGVHDTAPWLEVEYLLPPA